MSWLCHLAGRWVEDVTPEGGRPHSTLVSTPIGHEVKGDVTVFDDVVENVRRGVAEYGWSSEGGLSTGCQQVMVVLRCQDRQQK